VAIKNSIRGQLERHLAGGHYNIDSDVVMENGPSEGDFLIDVLLVGRRDPFVSSPVILFPQHPQEHPY